MPLRVLHVIPTLTGGGAEHFLCALTAATDPAAIRIGIMPVYPTPVPFSDGQLRSIDIIDIDRKGRYDAAFLLRMLRGIRRFRPDIVHAHLHNGKLWGRLTALAARVPIVVFTEHSPQGECPRLAERLLDGLVNRLTDAVITFTTRQRAMLERLDRIDAGKLRVIENGIPLPAPPDVQRRADARQILGVQDDDFAIVVLGRLAPIKNVQLAVRAVRELRNESAGIRLCVIGDGPQRSALEALAQSLGIADRISFLGLREDAVDLLYGCDALYIPSLVEGMPLAALEGMAVGLPVITAPWPGSEQLVGERNFGIVLADWNARTAAAAFEYASAHREDLRKMGERALRFARRRYDIRRAARLHERLYFELAHRKGLR